MEPIILLILSISVIGIFILFAFSQFKIENNLSGHVHGGNHNFNAFLTKIKGNLSKIRR